MKLDIACQMDPIELIDVPSDSTLALLLEAQARGHNIFYYTPSEMTLHGDRLNARGWTLTVRDDPARHFELYDAREVDLKTRDVILLRQDPPFDLGYITTTYLLERVNPGTLVINDPAHVRNAPEKVFVLDFQDLMPPTMVTRSLDAVRSFRKKHKDIIIKPLYGAGGSGVFRLRPDDTNLNALVELFQTILNEPFMVQEYRPEVREGDKRIILVDGEVAGAINRVPAKDEARANIHVGGQVEHVEISERDREICKRLSPELKRRGLLFTGIDVIGPYLTEINVTSPTGIRQIKSLGGADIAALVWDAIEQKVTKA